MKKGIRRVKDMVAESTINEAQVRDATPAFENLMNSVPELQSALGGAYSAASQIAAAAKQALEAISSARQTATSIGVEQNAIIDNINAAQQADPSQSIVTLTDHRNGVQQAYNILSTIVTSLGNAMALSGKLNELASRQFL